MFAEKGTELTIQVSTVRLRTYVIFRHFPGDSQALVAARIGIAVLIGLATGLEREGSGHATGPDARFAGLRTLSLAGWRPGPGHQA